jgi:molecular chaperone GrpE
MDTDQQSKPADGPGSAEPEPPFKVDDRRHWACADREEDDATPADEAPSPSEPSAVAEYRRRAEAAEAKLIEYSAAFQRAQAEHEQFRERMLRDVDRRVELKFGGLVEELLDLVDDLDLALAHATGSAAIETLAHGVRLARDRFLAALARAGVERVDPDGTAFDPNVAEAIRLDPVSDPARDGTVTETLRAGYRIGERVLRAARVAVGRLES